MDNRAGPDPRGLSLDHPAHSLLTPEAVHNTIAAAPPLLSQDLDEPDEPFPLRPPFDQCNFLRSWKIRRRRMKIIAPLIIKAAAEPRDDLPDRFNEEPPPAVITASGAHESDSDGDGVLIENDSEEFPVSFPSLHRSRLSIHSSRRSTQLTHFWTIYST